MNITPELVAELIFKISTLRYLEREYALEPNFDNRLDMLKQQTLIDDLLRKYDWYEYMSQVDILKSLIENKKQNEIAA